MFRPRKMKFIELTVLKNGMSAALEYLGKKAAIQFPDSDSSFDTPETARIREIITRIYDAAGYLNIELKPEVNENVCMPQSGDDSSAECLCSAIEGLKDRQYKTELEKSRVYEAITEARAFSKMNVPFSDFEHLSFLTLRFGRIDPKVLTDLRASLADRAVIIPLESGRPARGKDADFSSSGNDFRILAASSRKGRFAMDSQLKKFNFEPVAVPENYKGIPSQMMASLNDQYEKLKNELAEIHSEKDKLRAESAPELLELLSSWNIALIIEGIKARFTATENLYHFSGWIPADISSGIIKDLSHLTNGRIAARAYSPNEVPSIASGREKVPVAMKHSAFVRGFEGVVFSYGAPLYGTIDPTPVVAFFFTLMFGIMFGDVGQGFVLLLTGILLSRAKKRFSNFRKYSTPLVSVGIASMIMGLLTGSVFANEKLLTAPTRAVTAAITGQPMDHVLHILPMAGEGGSVTKLLYFFGFTVAIGVIVNSLALIINIFNRCTLKKYQAAFFSKTGLAGLLLFWYALFIAVRLISGGKFYTFDLAGLIVPLVCIFFGPIIWQIIAGEKPAAENGLLAFVMEGFVEVMETVSTYISNTVSFLRVGAFALAHAVFSFIIFYFTDELARSGLAGTLSAALIMIAGNAIIIALEGLIVAIQVIRLQYYEFFNKFFIETGVEFAPFSFKHKE